MEDCEISFSEDSDDIFEDEYDFQKQVYEISDKEMSLPEQIEKCSKFIFAEDLVSFIASEFHGLVYSTTIEKGPDSYFYPFNEILKKAVSVIRWQINDINCTSFGIIGKRTQTCKLTYQVFVDAVLDHYSEKELKPGSFLYLCVYFGELAAKCYRNDFEEIFTVAVYAILDAFSVFNGKILDLAEFAEDIVYKVKDPRLPWSSESGVLEEKSITNKEQCCGKDQVEETLSTLGKLKLIDKTNEMEGLSDLEFAMNENVKNIEEHVPKKLKFSREQLGHTLKSTKFNNLTRKLDLTVIKVIEMLTKYLRSNVTDTDFSTYGTNVDSLNDEVTESEKRFSSENRNFKDFYQVESTSFPCLEDSLFSPLHLLQENQLNFGLKEKKYSANKKGNIESSEHFRNIDLGDSDLVSEQLECSDFLEKEIEKLTQTFLAEILQESSNKSEDPNAASKFKDIKITNTEDEAFNFLTAMTENFENSILGNVENYAEFAIIKIIEKLSKSVRCNLKNIDFSVYGTDSALFSDKKITEREKIIPPSENYNFKDCLQEVMFVINFEALLLENQQKSKEDSFCENKRHIIESPEHLIIQNMEIGDSDLMSEELDSNKFLEKEAETFTQTSLECSSELMQENARKSESLKIPDNEDFLQNQLIHPSAMENIEGSSLEVAENYGELRKEKTKNPDYCETVSVDDKNQHTLGFLAFYKLEGNDGEENVKVLKGDSLLFAEEFISYVIKEFYGDSYSEMKFDAIRFLSNNAFDENVKEVIRFIHDDIETLNTIAFDFIINEKEHRVDSYRKYTNSVLSHYTDDGLNSDKFLYYCLHFSEIAFQLYTSHVPEILDLALCSILDAFCLLKDDWNEFSIAVENVLKLFKSRNGSDYIDFESESLNTILDICSQGKVEKATKMKLRVFRIRNNLL